MPGVTTTSSPGPATVSSARLSEQGGSAAVQLLVASSPVGLAYRTVAAEAGGARSEHPDDGQHGPDRLTHLAILPPNAALRRWRIAKNAGYAGLSWCRKRLSGWSSQSRRWPPCWWESALAVNGSSRSRPALARAGEGTVPHAVGPPRTIVMVVFDELPLTSLLEPGGRIDASRYPAFAGLARDGIWYRGATAVHDSTALAVPAMLDGRYPRPGLQSDVYSHPQNLFTLLAGDYELHVSEEATGLCPTSLCVPTPGTTASHLSRGKPGRFRRFVRGVRPTPRPALWFKHVLLPHVPWQYYPSGRSYRRFAPEPIPGSNSELGFWVPWLVKVSYQRHLLQLGMADRLLGELVARLRGTGLYRDALVMVVADHGIGFRVGSSGGPSGRATCRTWRRCR